MQIQVCVLRSKCKTLETDTQRAWTAAHIEIWNEYSNEQKDMLSQSIDYMNEAKDEATRCQERSDAVRNSTNIWEKRKPLAEHGRALLSWQEEVRRLAAELRDYGGTPVALTYTGDVDFLEIQPAFNTVLGELKPLTERGLRSSKPAGQGWEGAWILGSGAAGCACLWVKLDAEQRIREVSRFQQVQEHDPYGALAAKLTQLR